MNSKSKSAILKDALRKYGAGSVLWVSDPKEINRWQHIAVDESRLHIPVIFGLDVIHGYHTIFPAPIAMASSWDPKMVEAAQTVAAREARAAGIAWTFGPMVDIARDARWGRMVEGAGEDPYLGAAMARAQVLGFQGTQPGALDRVLACAKHFAGYGAADGGRDYDSSYIPEEQMWNTYLPPFKAAADAGVATFMSAYMDLNDVPATGNRWLLHDVLREAWNFKGFVVSDANAVHSLITHGYARDGDDAAYKAFTAGLDMDMASGTYLKYLADEVSERPHFHAADRRRSSSPSSKPKSVLDSSSIPSSTNRKIGQVLNDPEHQQLARTAVQRSVVLLRNEQNTLPLDKSKIKSIAVIGPLADAQLDLLDMWGALIKPGPTVEHPAGNQEQSRQRRSEWNSLMARTSGATSHHSSKNSQSSRSRSSPKQTPEEARKAFDDAVALAKRSDVAILVLGEIALMSGEAASRSSLKLSGGQEELLEAVVATGKPVVLVLVNGRPLDISWASEHVPAILETWYPGSQAGNGIADILFGDANPAGHLARQLAAQRRQLPLYYNHTRTHAPEDAPDFKSRYWDILSTPLYPFGYGLSYTTFSFDNLKLSQTEAKVGSQPRCLR